VIIYARLLFTAHVKRGIKARMDASTVVLLDASERLSKLLQRRPGTLFSSFVVDSDWNYTGVHDILLCINSTEEGLSLAAIQAAIREERATLVLLLDEERSSAVGYVDNFRLVPGFSRSYICEVRSL